MDVVQAIKDRIPERTYRYTRNQNLAALLSGLNRMLAGWANYFRHGASKKTFAAIDHHTWQRIARWLLRKHRIPRGHLRRFCDQGWRFAEGSVAFRGASRSRSSAADTAERPFPLRGPSNRQPQADHRARHVESLLR
ncbi:group II intron maturase-specific domain-containing protein [Nonomuraea fuscirosea]|uniref:group II intron maturase-specific domain-containing protein n=1 Tax=Nonomuraea fuscirosea TaxID=1291556 RepID=UPI003438724E